MKYLGVLETSKLWGVSERAVRDYCNKGRIEGAVLNGKKWMIPENAKKPKRKMRHHVKNETLLETLIREKEARLGGGIYHRLQVEMAYNSNHIEGSILTHEQTRHIFETKTIDSNGVGIPIDDIVEASNHFRCVDLAIDSAKSKLTESLIKQFHLILKSGTSDSMKPWFNIGDYKLLENEVGGRDTASPQEVKAKIKELILWYNSLPNVTVRDIVEFHYRFERIHPFQDGNGRVGRLIMLKECLKHGFVPILILDEYKGAYYKGLKEWEDEPGYLMDTCLYCQGLFECCLDRFGIKH